MRKIWDLRFEVSRRDKRLRRDDSYPPYQLGAYIGGSELSVVGCHKDPIGMSQQWKENFWWNPSGDAREEESKRIASERTKM